MRRSSPSRCDRKARGRRASCTFRTNVDDWVACGPDHALRFEPEPETGGLKPYLHVRRDLWAQVTRALFYDLVELGEERDVGRPAHVRRRVGRRILRHGAGRRA